MSLVLVSVFISGVAIGISGTVIALHALAERRVMGRVGQGSLRKRHTQGSK